MKTYFTALTFVIALFAAPLARPAVALEKLCDPAEEDCRTLLINLIRNERVRIDVAFWFMEDARYTNELIKRWQAGVPVRVIVDSRANPNYPLNATRLAELRTAGIPMREKFTSGILHWKMMLFAGQGTVQFSGANYSAHAWLPIGSPWQDFKYKNYIDESIYFTDTPSLFGSFATRFDDLWVNITGYRDFANITVPLVRQNPIFTKDPELNFAPKESFANRSVSRYNAETVGIDVVMYRITDRRHTDAIIAARSRGVPVRLITEPAQYRDVSRLWHSWNVDRLYMAGVKIMHRAHAGLNHQKSVLLHGQRMTIFGSSNWTSPSSDSQEEHNLFTTDSVIYNWFVDQFQRKWFNMAGITENVAFKPLPPDTPKTPTPANLATGIAAGSSVILKWYGGPWAHNYDIYFGTSSTPPLVARNVNLGPSASTSTYQKYTVPVVLQRGTTYYWKIVSKTMANQTKTSPVWSFRTQ